MEKEYKIYFVSSVLIFIVSFSSFVLINDQLNAKNPLQNLTNPDTGNSNTNTDNLDFNGTRAFSYLKAQVDIGFRPPNSSGIEKTRVLIIEQLLKFNWTVELNNFTYMGVKSVNILAFPGNSNHSNVVLFGAHYDTRWWADDDLDVSKHHDPVMGANDGASGVAVLLEFAQIFANKSGVALLFIDAEDQGGINGWEYGAGAYEFVNSTVLNQFFPNGKSDIKLFLLFDMIGDWHLNIKKERFSNATINDQIWQIANELNYGTAFTNDPGYYMIDDHTAFLQAGISAVDLIDYDYYDANGSNLHHTTHDTLQYVSADSLSIVGKTIQYWFEAFGKTI